MVKRVEAQRVYFAPLERLIETIIFTGSSVLVFCSVFKNFLNSVAFLVFLS